MTRVTSILLGLVFALTAAQTGRAAEWADIEAAARGQTVAFHAWAGEDKINAYIAWVGQEVKSRYGIELRHVKLADTGEAVSRVVAEKSAGRNRGGAVDLVWINGANFAAMKEKGLLAGPFLSTLPGAAGLDPASAANRADFTTPVDGYEVPWSLAQLVFYADTTQVPSPPQSLPALADWIRAHPGRFTYPDPSNFLGATFLKQLLVGLSGSDAALAAPVTDEAYQRLPGPVWAWLNGARPHLWRAGRTYPANSAALRNLVADGEVTIGLSLDPAEASAGIASGVLPASTRSFGLQGGTIGNASFVAIPYNAAHKEGAMVVANFLLSPEAQARKQDPAVWGALTVLEAARLSPADQARFAAVGTVHPEMLGAPLAEPHPSWSRRLVEDWTRRYSAP